MEEKSNGKGKLTPSLPPNYISIIQLRERWNNEKNRKQKEEEAERRRKQEIEEQRRIEEEEDLKKREQEKRRNSKKKESVVILSERGDCEVPRDDGVGEPKKKRNKGKFRKRYDSRKKRNHDVEENVVDERGLTVTEIDTPGKDGSIAMPVYVVKESNAPVIQVYREKGGGEEAKDNGPREKPVPIETRFDDSVPRGEGLGKKKTRNYRRKKEIQDVAVEEDVVECGMENKTLVKDVVTFYREKAKCKEPREKAVAIETQSEDLVPRDEGLGKKKKKKKKKNKNVVAVGECESMVTEKKTPMIRVYREKRVYKEAKGDGSCEGAVTAIEAQFENLSIQRGETKDLKEQTKSGNFGKRREKIIQDVVPVEETLVQCEATVRAMKTPVKGVIQVYKNLSVKTKDLKAETRSSNRNQPNERRDLHSQRVGMDAATMVWVKKGQKERDDGIGSNVKTLSA